MDHDHVARKQTGRICAASRIGLAPKHNSAIDVRRVSQYVVELNSESVEMAHMQWAKIGIEAVVDEAIIDGKVRGGRTLRAAGDGGGANVLRFGGALMS